MALVLLKVIKRNKLSVNLISMLPVVLKIECNAYMSIGCIYTYNIFIIIMKCA